MLSGKLNAGLQLGHDDYCNQSIGYRNGTNLLIPGEFLRLKAAIAAGVGRLRSSQMMLSI